MPSLQTLPSEARILAKKSVLALKRIRKTLHAKQEQAFISPATEILYGGAAGGGKSHFLRVLAIILAKLVPGLQVYLFRREFPDLWKNHMEGPTSFPVLLAPLVEAGLCKINYSDHFIKFRNGSTIHLCHCQHEKDMWGYQGSEMHVLMVEEVTQFTLKIYRYLRSRVRLGAMASKIPAKFKAVLPRVVCTGNPGGIGHNWVKATWIDFAPPMEVKKAVGDGGFLRQYIPAKLEDNPTLLEDEGYEERLSALGDAALVKAMRDGDWNVVAGGMFDDVYRPNVHEIEPFEIPFSWKIDRSFDWGSSKPFSVGWWAESDGTAATLKDGTKKAWPRGTLFRIAEWYGWNGNPNEGCKMLAVEVARGIVKIEKEVPWGPRVQPGPADSSIFDAENGVCLADDMARCGVRWLPADKSPGSRKTGWEGIRKRFKACLTHPMEDAGLFVFNTCRNGFIRTVPTLPRDSKKPEDVDTNAEDHCLAGSTLVDTEWGQVPISDLVGKTGLVYSLDGRLHPFHSCRLTRMNAPMVRIRFANGSSLRCTPDHLILTQDGRWIEAGGLADEIGYSIFISKGSQCSSRSSALPFKNSRESGSIFAGPISSGRASASTGWSGSPSMGQSRPGCMFTTWTGIDPITNLGTWLSCMERLTYPTIQASVLSTPGRPSGRPCKPPQSGMGAKRESNGIGSSIGITVKTQFINKNCGLANNAGPNSLEENALDSVQTLASPPLAVSPASTTSSGSVLFAGRLSLSIDSGLTKRVGGHAEESWLAVSVEESGPEDVYCLKVDTTRAFSVEGGLIVHNCGDEVRYRILKVAGEAKTIKILGV